MSEDKCEICGKEVFWKGNPEGNEENMSVIGGSESILNFGSIYIICSLCHDKHPNYAVERKLLLKISSN